MYDDKKTQCTLIGAVIVKIIPPAARVAYEWAEMMYDSGVRIHPQLVGQEGSALSGPAQPPTPAETQQAVRDRSFAVLHEMAARFPQFRPLVAKVESANTDEERAAVLTELRSQIDPQMLATAEARAGLIVDDNPE